MSIKSQKSLNDECSEIFEASYSPRSASEDSMTGDEDDDSLSRDLMKKLTPAVLSKLRRCFKKAKDRNAAQDIDRRVAEVMRAAAAEEGVEFAAPPWLPPTTLCLDESGFVTALDNIFGHRRYSAHAHQLFRALDPLGSGRVWWRQVVARMLAAGARCTSQRNERWRPATELGFKRLDYCKRETIVKLVSVERPESFCYVGVSRGGHVAVCDAQLRVLHRYNIFYHRTGIQRRIKNCWITDAVYLSDVQYLLYSASDRSLTIYDATTLTHSPLYCITGLPNIPTCVAYQPARDEPEMMFGTDNGDITRIRFLQPRLSLLYNKTPDDINYYFWMELTSPPHTHYCRLSTWRRVHTRAVRRLSYVRDGDIVLSCSLEGAESLRWRHVNGKLDDYVFKVHRGISCFHMVWSLRVLATGSADGVVRLWETPTAPFACLTAPAAPPVLDVAIAACMDVVLAYCSNCFVYIWDLYEECLLQTIKIKFPFLGVLGKKAEFGAVSIHSGPPRVEDEDGDGQRDACSRRGSSVCRGATGGLRLLASEPSGHARRPDPEVVRWNRTEVLITCCDCVCSVALRPCRLPAPPPPRDTLRARRPSFWELPPDLICIPPRVPEMPERSKQSPPSPKLLTPIVVEDSLQDLDELLEKAGLTGLLEKDFVLMRGLKHDLNKKLHEMETNKEAVKSAVTVGAPYLALKNYEPDPLPTFEHLAQKSSRILGLCTESKAAITPSGSDFSSPRNSNSFKL